MKTAFQFIRTVSLPIAARAAATILLVIGAFAVASFLWNAPWYAKILCALFLAATWYLLYQFEFCYRTRRTLGRQS